MQNGRTGVINRRGEMIVTVEYDSVTIDDVFILAKCDDKWTCFDKSGKVIAEQYDIIRTDGEYLCVQKGQKMGLLDKKGTVLIEPVYEQIWPLEENLFEINEGGSCGALWIVTVMSEYLRCTVLFFTMDMRIRQKGECWF